MKDNKPYYKKDESAAGAFLLLVAVILGLAIIDEIKNPTHPSTHSYSRRDHYESVRQPPTHSYPRRVHYDPYAR